MTNITKKEIVVEIDDREVGIEEIAPVMVNWNVKFKKKRLKCGDYKYKNLIIERKTMDDFCSSILDGRMKEQTKKMLALKDKYYDCFIFIIGKIKDRTIDIHENCVLGKIVSLAFKHEIPTIVVDDEFQFLYCLRNLCDKYDFKYSLGDKK